MLKEINDPNKFNCNKSIVLTYLTSFVLSVVLFCGRFCFLGEKLTKNAVSSILSNSEQKPVKL